MNNITSSLFQNKEWRKSQDWYSKGKSTECEKYQIGLLEDLMGIKWNKTLDRLNYETCEIKEKRYLGEEDGFEWSETFDGKIIQPSSNPLGLKDVKTMYFNLKFVCDQGGAQMRTLREVYIFIKHQLEFLCKNNTTNIYFYNILDGDQSFKNMSKFKYLLNKPKYKDVKERVFVGSLYKYSLTYYSKEL